MQLKHLDAAVMLGIIVCQISSIRLSSSPTDCLDDVNTCMSHLCKSEEAFYNGMCDVTDERCQIKGSKVCNLTIHNVMGRFPSLRGCVCAWEGEFCDSIHGLAAQCQQKPAHQKRSTVNRQSSGLPHHALDGDGSCLNQMGVCLQDVTCNKYLAPVLKECTADYCNNTLCQQVTRQFYTSVPFNMAEMLVMCECDASHQDCLYMKNILHSGTCENKDWICLDAVNQCVKDWDCRNLLKSFQSKCWIAADAQCSGGDLGSFDCISQMDPALILGVDPECKMAFVATFGTALMYPCTCKGLHSDDLVKCSILQDILHNRSHFMIPRKQSEDPHEPPKGHESEQPDRWVTDYLLHAFAYVLLAGVVLLLLIAVLGRVWVLKKRNKRKAHPPQKSHFVDTI
ncbi:GDNF family receptor alpha-like [Genypterus blacodes]|uniref:GDNF family receptor alpha-like n=1 Tax=Genypterus blacodes TaxID=154954 RepID=UPI003F759783